MLPFLVALAFIAEPANSDVTQTQFVQLMQGLYSDVHTITFVYEGGSFDIKGDVETLQAKYQGLYSYRRDGATLLDVFFRSPRNDTPGSRLVWAMINGDMTRSSQSPDLGVSGVSASAGGGGPGVLNRPYSPERILYYWYMDSIKNPDKLDYAFKGWEDYDGHRCLYVQFSELAKGRVDPRSEDFPTVRLWIDMERGGHPLRVEFWKGNHLFMKSHRIKLERFPLPDGRSVWFPVLGVHDEYVTFDEKSDQHYVSSPSSRETYAVAVGSVRFNQKLPDNYFTAKRKNAAFSDAELSARQRELNFAPKPLIRSDPEGARAHLEQQLREADRQSQRLDASAAARSDSNWSLYLIYALALLGFFLLGGVAFWRWRHG